MSTRFGVILRVCSLLALGGCITQTSSNSQAPGTEVSIGSDRPPMIGIAVPRSRAAIVAQVEESIGVPFDVIRVFRRWDAPLLDDDLTALIDGGHRLHLSLRPVRADGSPIAWIDLATAQPGQPLYSELETRLAEVAAMPAGTYFTMSHEPESKEGKVNGDASAFKAMWQRVATLLEEQGGEDIVMVWTMTGGAFSDDRAQAWYPGDDVVDVVGTDSYNWFTCQGTERRWYELEQLLSQPLDFARAHGKPLAVPEFASAADPADPQRRAQWMRNAAQYLTGRGADGSIEYVAWFNVTSPGGTYPNCVWDYDTTTTSTEAFAELVRSLSRG